MPVHTLPLNEGVLDRSAGGASRWPKFTPEEAAQRDEFTLSPSLQTIEDRVHATLTIEQG